MKKDSFYITTTLPYVNSEPHIGHALEFVRADAIVRFKREKGFDVFFNTGTDEHGSKINESADKAGVETIKYVDKYSEIFKELHKSINISYDGFIRTTDKKHMAAAEEMWRRCEKNGYIYKKIYKAKYCVGCELNKTDSELIDGVCPLHPNREIELIDEENYFFKFSAFGDRLLEMYEKNPDLVVPDFRFNEIKRFVERGLEDFSISRLRTKMPWGVTVTGDSEHVMYVWFDALTSYISTLGWPESGNFEKYWEQAENNKRSVVQCCGKDNLRQQSAMWQAMLMAADLPNSTQILINGFILSGGEKMSKSQGNVISPQDIIESYKEATDYPEEVLRFVLLHDMPLFEDGDITMESIQASYTAHLVNGIGNLTNRIMKMATSNNIVCLDNFENLSPEVSASMNNFDTRGGIMQCMEDVRALDKFIQDTEPFKVIKVDEDKGTMLIGECLADLQKIAYNLKLFLPRTSVKILECIEEHKMPEKPLFNRN